MKVTIVLGHMLCVLMDQYYPQSTRFIPERWLKTPPGDEAHAIGSVEDYGALRDIRRHPFAILPFGFGHK
ncbi:hypothetical protein J437_LFUL003443 [Ladona fulva]|uniref:Uncharacterized protein n=1 Tax=Ladona fulva TaxID=123851 RepID=A0A8K0K262_LADFU|nr:hypothetical protein J437_LFUL003443 [Ladona fulva]